jgi:hypothetical protein
MHVSYGSNLLILRYVNDNRVCPVAYHLDDG